MNADRETPPVMYTHSLAQQYGRQGAYGMWMQTLEGGSTKYVHAIWTGSNNRIAAKSSSPIFTGCGLLYLFPALCELVLDHRLFGHLTKGCMHHSDAEAGGNPPFLKK